MAIYDNIQGTGVLPEHLGQLVGGGRRPQPSYTEEDSMVTIILAIPPGESLGIHINQFSQKG